MFFTYSSPLGIFSGSLFTSVVLKPRLPGTVRGLWAAAVCARRLPWVGFLWVFMLRKLSPAGRYYRYRLRGPSPDIGQRDWLRL